MTNTDDRQHRSILQRIAHRVMLEKGLVPDFPPQALAELDGIHGPATQVEGGRVISGTFSGAPLTTMIRVIWTSLPLPKPYLTGPPRSWSPLPTWTRSSTSNRCLTLMC